MIILRMFYEFFMTGLLAIGGGLATLPFLYEMADKTGWFTREEVLNMIAVGESTPGPIGVNMATYAGFNTIGLFGGVITTLALVTPSVIVILIIARVLQKFRSSPITEGVFSAIRPASTALIAAAAINVLAAVLFHGSLSALFTDFLSVFDLRALIIGLIIFAAITKFKGSPIIYLLASAVVGIILKM